MTTHEPLITIVIPCLNEAESIPVIIPDLIRCIKAWSHVKFEDFEVIVVDDGSTDNSADLLSHYPDISILQNKHSLGYGGALKKGFGAARGKYITFFDLDRTYDPGDLESMYGLLTSENFNVIFGDRMSQQNNMPATRHLGNFIFASLIRILYRVKMKDVCTGMRIFKRELISEILVLPENGLNFSIALTILILNKRLRWTQFPIRYHERIGRSKLSVVSDGWLFLVTILRNYRIQI
jgi:glycosyltransferase involved in cell wall biosynthesis